MGNVRNSESCLKMSIRGGIHYQSSYDKHVLFLDDLNVTDSQDFIACLNNGYNDLVYDSNTKIRLKLLLNLDDYVLLQNNFFPVIFF